MGRADKQRDFGLDLVRAAAGVLTLSVHFFLNNGFYDTPAAGKTMLAACMVRMLCMTCVPLFLLLTGYTCVNRKWSKGYYRKLLPVLFTYVLAGAACLAFRHFWLGESWGLKGIVRQFTIYAAAPYAWYIEMYIGLFLLSPFFNAAWHALEDSGKKALVLTLACLTALPGLINQVGALLPAWWVGIYPLTYYAIGAWLRDHPLRLKGWQCLLCWLGLAAVVGAKGYFTAAGGNYAWMPEDQWGSLALTLESVCLFSCLKMAKGERLPAPLRWCVARVAKLALPMYLVSYIADQIIYPVLNKAVPQAQLRLFWMPLVVPVVVLCSLVLAQLADWAAEALMRLVPAKTQNAADAQCRDTKES